MTRRWRWASVTAVLLTAACADGSATDPGTPRGATAAARKSELAGRGSVRSSASAPMLAVGAPALDLAGGSRMYEVFVDDSPAELGVFTVGTGPDHPVTLAKGARQSVLYGGSDADPFSSYLTVRSHTSGTDYAQGGLGSDGSSRIALRPGERGIAASVAAVPGGFRTTYDLPGGGGAAGTPDRLRIEQLVRASGATFDDAAVEVTTVITNTGASSVALGLRYLWDVQVSRDDGPALFTHAPDAGPFTFERSFVPTSFGFWHTQDNRDASSPAYRVFGTLNGPSGVSPAASGATRFVQASWADAYNAPFAYTENPAVEAACEGGCDNALLYFKGDAPSNAVTLAPGASMTYSQSLAAGTMTAAPLRFSNRAPIASAGGPYSGSEGAAIGFTAAASSDPDGDALTYAWDFTGDGVTDRTGKTTTFTFPDNGSYVARVTVTDARGASSTATAPVTVANVAPFVSRVYLSLPTMNMPRRGTSWALEFSFTDQGTVDGPWLYSIDWGDGTAPSTGSEASMAARVSRAHVYTTTGSRTARITIRDKDGASSSRTLAVTVVP